MAFRFDGTSVATEQIEDAAKDGDLALVRKLLDDGANVEGPDDSWTTPLWWACRVGYDDVERYLGVIRLLMERGARVDVELPPAKPDRTACGRLLLESVHVDHKSGEHGRTQLHGACIIGKTDVVRGLLLLGADINIADATGKTPLDYALRFPAPDHETPTNNGALEYLLDDHLPVFWKRLFALTFARVPGHAVAGDEYLARHLGSFLVGDDLLK